MADTQVILHVKGTEQTTSLPKVAVRSAVKEGRISYSQLIWSPIANAWKQVRELPEFWPSQKLAPAPPRKTVNPPAATPVHAPKIRAVSPPKVTLPAAHPKIATSGTVPTPRIATGASPKIASKPQARVSAARPAARVAARSSAENRLPSDELPVLIAKWACLGAGALVVLILGANYGLVDRPLESRLAATPYAQSSVHAYFGGFVQLDQLVIHLAPSSSKDASSLPLLVAALSRNTPARMGGDGLYDSVSLTPGWISRYSIPGVAWEELAKLDPSDEEGAKNFILDHLDSPSGRPLAGPDVPPETRDQVWNRFVADFTR